MMCSRKSKRESWDKKETQYLLRLIRERQVMKSLDGKKFRSEEIFKHLEKPMESRGYLKSAKQMQTKFKTLRFQFNQYRRKSVVNGDGNQKNDFPYYTEMEVLLGDRPVGLEDIGSATGSSSSLNTDPSIDLEDSGEEIDDVEPSRVVDVTISSEDTESSENISNEKPAKKVKRSGSRSYEKSLEKFAEITKNNMLESQNDIADRQERLIMELFRQQQNFEKELMTAFFEHQRVIMQETTTTLLQGLRGLLPTSVSKHGQGCQCLECV